MKKKIVCLILCILILTFLGGCGNSSDASAVRIAYLAGEASADFSERVAKRVNDLLAETSDKDTAYDVTVYFADGSFERQLSQIGVCADLHYDLIIIDPADPSRAEELLADCIDVNVTEITEEGKEIFELTVSNEHYEAGGTGAEPANIVSGVFDPPTETVPLNVIFCGNVPVGSDDGERNVVYAGYDVSRQAEMLVNGIVSRAGDPDINGDGSVLFAFLGTDSANPVNTLMIEEVTSLLQVEYPEASMSFTLQYPGSSDTFLERFKSNMTGKNVPADILIALDDRAMTLCNDFAHTCGYEEDESIRIPMTFTPGENVWFTGFGSKEDSFSMYDEGRVLCLIGADADELADAVASSALSLLSGSVPSDVILEPFMYETPSSEEDR